MSSIALAVFKATIGLLVNKARDKAAEKLKDGDVTDQKFRAVIIREIDDIKSKLDGISRKDLLSSISFFKEGIEILYEVFGKVMSRRRSSEVATVGDNETPPASASSETLALANAGIAELKLDESDTKMLIKAKGRFDQARIEATRAFNNEALDVRERILAMEYRLMSTILEAIDNPIDAFPMCKVCLEELHALPEVQKNVKVQIEKGFLSKFGKDDRKDIISTVCQLNYVVYDVFGNRDITSNWPYIDTGKERIDPLRDHRMSLSCKLELRSLYLCRSFSRSTEPFVFATNTQGQFIVALTEHSKRAQMLDKTGKSLQYLKVFDECLTEEERQNYRLQNVTTDRDDNTYILIVSTKQTLLSAIYVIDRRMEHCRRLLQETSWLDSIAVTEDGTIFGVESLVGVNVYNTDGKTIHTFSLGRYIFDITATKDNCVMALDSDNNVHYLSAQEHGISKIKVKGMPRNLKKEYKYGKIAYHRQSERLVVVLSSSVEVYVFVYTQSGDLTGSFIWHGLDGDTIPRYPRWASMAVTPEGCIAMVTMVQESPGSVFYVTLI